MVDVDCFKFTNDTYGHPVGDKVLVEIADRMRETVRSYDAVGRIGGDEFLIVLPGCDTEAAAYLAERIRKQLATAYLSVPDDEFFPITVSMGVASSAMGIGLDEDDLIMAADSALLRAKQMGRDRVEVRQSAFAVVM
jgi:diguanylate cyclase (GGDEF)-like protein